MCIFKLLFGYPCPGCGLTRANLMFFSGRVGEAFAMHPLFIAADIFLLYLVWYFFIKKKKATKSFWILCLFAVAVYIITYIIRFYFNFGKCEPFLYYDGALVPYLFSLTGTL